MMWQPEASSAGFEACVVYCTAASAEEAERIAEALVGERLAACCTLLPGVTSIYRWKGDVQREKECLLLIKSDRRLFERLEQRIRELHSYEVPEIIAVPVTAGSESYLAWMRDSIVAVP
jgi:periplasmic divalent cation tolerance protein